MMHNTNDFDLASMTAEEVRSLIRRGQWSGDTSLAARNYVQANLVIVPEEWAFDFLLFCSLNPKACPLLDVTEPGSPHPRLAAPESDLRTDLPRYLTYIDGEAKADVTDITDCWRKDLVAFLLGCSLTFDWLLRAANISYQLIGAYATNILCAPARRLSGFKIVSVRLFNNAAQAIQAIQLTSRYPNIHGAPIHMGDPAALGIKDIYHPEFSAPAFPTGDLPFTIKPSDVLLYWECGITPQLVAMQCKLPLMITHFAGHMFITDWLVQDLAAL